MDDLFVIRDGERFKVNIVYNFKFNGNLYCVYSIVNKEDEIVMFGKQEEILKRYGIER